MIQYKKEIRNGKIVTNITKEELSQISTTRQKRKLSMTKEEREYQDFLAVLRYLWDSYGGGYHPNANGEITACVRQST